MADTYFSRTNTSGGDRKTFTLSTWLKLSNIDIIRVLFDAGTSTTTDSGRFTVSMNSANKLFVGGGATSYRLTSRVFRDVSAWYHIVIAVDSTQVTADDRIKIYINGTLETSFDTNNAIALNQNTPVNENAKVHQISGDQLNSNNYFDGYMAHVNFTDGTAYDASAFGETDTNGQWSPIPAPSVTYGTNGFFLKFANSGSLGTDSSGNGNDFTKNGSGDQVTDTPDNVFATMNPLYRSRQANNGVFSEGNTKLTYTASNDNKGTILSTMGASSGKWYWEVKVLSASREMIGVGYNNVGDTTGAFHDSSPSNGFSIFAGNGNLYYDATNTSYGSSFSVNDIIMVALDMDNHLCWFGKNGTWFNSATQSEIENSTATNDATTKMGTQQNLNSGEPVFPLLADTSATGQASFEANFGNPPFSISSGNSDDNGYGNFEYAPPSGYLALCTKNLASELTLPIGDGSEYFHTQLYTGDGQSSKVITNDANAGDFKPDWLWIKERSSTSAHLLFDSNRGTDKRLRTNGTNAEETFAYLSSFDTDGFTINTSDAAINENNQTYAAWQWRANGGTTSSNSDGSITSTVQANTTAGFSTVTWTGTGANATVGHGLGVAPSMIISKNRDLGTGDWVVYHSGIGATKYLQLNQGASAGTSAIAWNDTEPTSSVFSVGTWDSGNGSNDNIVSYCFAEIEGYNKMGTYTGNGNADGTFVYTGFRPSWIMLKRTDGVNDWILFDSKRLGYNGGNYRLYPNQLYVEDTTGFDLLSNGFKARMTGTTINGSGNSYIYIAFAKNPFVDSTGRPVTAR